jgi:hypothetical protein
VNLKRAVTPIVIFGIAGLVIWFARLPRHITVEQPPGTWAVPMRMHKTWHLYQVRLPLRRGGMMWFTIDPKFEGEVGLPFTQFGLEADEVKRGAKGQMPYTLNVPPHGSIQTTATINNNYVMAYTLGRPLLSRCRVLFDYDRMMIYIKPPS